MRAPQTIRSFKGHLVLQRRPWWDLVSKISISWLKIQTGFLVDRKRLKEIIIQFSFSPSMEPTCLAVLSTCLFSTILITIFTWAPHNIKPSPNVLKLRVSEVRSVLARTPSTAPHPSPSPLQLKPVHRDVPYLGFSWKSSPQSISCQFRSHKYFIIFPSFNENRASLQFVPNF